jgi:hypothetical protein
MIDKYSKKQLINKRKLKDTRNEKYFECKYCRRTVDINAPGTHHRNHCPWCLRSVHVDEVKGDRATECGGIMEPIAVAVRRDNEWVLIHRCTVCGVLKGNRIAGDDNEVALLSLAVRPVARPPFPLDGLYPEKYNNDFRSDTNNDEYI